MAGETVVVSGTANDGGALNGTFTVTAVTGTTLSYTAAVADFGPTADSGTAMVCAAGPAP